MGTQGGAIVTFIARLIDHWRQRSAPPAITGRLVTSAKYDDDGNPIEVSIHWEGGAIAAITHAFVEDADPRWFRREGNAFVIGGHIRLKVIRHDRHMGFYYVQRAAPNDAVVRYPIEVQS